jgi:hypothetical protein
MFEKIFWFGVGFLVARYVVLNNPDYKAKEAKILGTASTTIDEIRNDVHDLIKKYNPEADDLEVANDVLIAIPEN